MAHTSDAAPLLAVQFLDLGRPDSISVAGLVADATEEPPFRCGSFVCAAARLPPSLAALTLCCACAHLCRRHPQPMLYAAAKGTLSEPCTVIAGCRHSPRHARTHARSQTCCPARHAGALCMH
jgi:hypothetical protein